MAKTPRIKTKANATASAAKGYVHSGTEAVARPAVGAAPRFKSKKPPNDLSLRLIAFARAGLGYKPVSRSGGVPDVVHCRRCDPHMFPEPRTLVGADKDALVEATGLRDAVERLRRLQAPVLNWSGKAERSFFDVPTLPLFVHECLPTTAIIETLTTHKRKVAQVDMLEMFNDPRRPTAEQVRACEHHDRGTDSRGP
jgi:adenine-specific DNA-methyltransferase